jgi:hypothetical protein
LYPPDPGLARARARDLLAEDAGLRAMLFI